MDILIWRRRNSYFRVQVIAFVFAEDVIQNK